MYPLKYKKHLEVVIMKKLIGIILAIALVLSSLAGCASNNVPESEDTIIVTDMAGNTVELPMEAHKLSNT